MTKWLGRPGARPWRAAAGDMLAPERLPRLPRLLRLTVVLGTLVACSPALDWRQAQLEGSGVSMLFPCRPDVLERTVRLAERVLRMQMHACKADGTMFSLAWVDAAAPDAVTPLLTALRAQAIGNVAGVVAQQAPSVVVGATPNGASVTLRVDGRLPDGRRVVEHAVFFVKGLRLYQATVLREGEPLGREPLENFFGAIRLP